jgi:hypothetical protein
MYPLKSSGWSKSNRTSRTSLCDSVSLTNVAVKTGVLYLLWGSKWDLVRMRRANMLSIHLDRSERITREESPVFSTLRAPLAEDRTIKLRRKYYRKQLAVTESVT